MLPTIRAFIAIEIDERVKRELARVQDRLKAVDPDIKFAEPRMRWTDPQNFHITLKFLGDIEPKQVDVIEEAMRKTAEEFHMFHMDIGTLGAFPNMNQPQVIWAGVTKRANFMTDMATRLDEILKANGVAQADHGFTPHITLGRSKNETPCKALSHLLQNTHIPAGLSQKVERITLLRSELFPKGPVYHTLFSAALNKDN